MKRGPSTEAAPPTPTGPRWPWWAAIVLCLAGLLLSFLLERIHYSIHTNPASHSFCGVDRKVNCDIVANSPYAVLFGVPFASWGLFGYAIATALSLWGARGRRALVTGWTLILAFAFVATSAALGAVSALLVTAVCILCLASYAVNLLFLGCALAATRGIGVGAALAEPFKVLRARPARTLSVLALLGGLALALIAAHPNYWKKGRQQNDRPRPSTPTLPHGVEPGGGHYLGAENPVVTLVEFSDYECPFCKQAHTQLRALLEHYPAKLRLVHRHYPLDQSCNSSLTSRMHENACFAAMIAECAGLQNRFWEANDYLFSEARMLHSRSNADIARDIGLDANALETCLREQGPRSVAIDVDEGNRLSIQGTPTFLIEGKTYMGTPPAWLVSRLRNPGVDAGGAP